MELQELLNYILYMVVTAILPVIVTYVINFIQAKIKESTIISEVTKNQELENLVEDALVSVMDAVLYVNQTYTDSLKASGSFNKEAQDVAYRKAYEKALSLISDGAKAAITELYGSFDRWIETKIEASVNMAKK